MTILERTALPMTLLLCGSALPAFAQQADGTIVLEPIAVTGQAAGSLTVPDAAEAERRIDRTPGAVAVVPAADFANTRALTTKDMLDYVPGVFAQPKWGEDTRFSIRGSGLARNFHLRGVKLLQDGIPLTKADGSGDFQEIDPLSLRYAEVYKGANALQYGAMTLGGAVNFVSPTGHDAPAALVRTEIGSDGFRRVQLGSGMAIGDWDYYVTPTWVQQDGFRNHSEQESVRVNGNIGYRISPNAETRFYFGFADIEQDIPGSVTRHAALHDPRAAAVGNLLLDYERNIESYRIANKTTVMLDAVELSFGAFYVDKQLDHPIFQVLDNHFQDYGGFARAAGETQAFGHRNAFTVGANLHAGTNDNERYQNIGGSKGAKTFDTDETAINADLYAENQFFLTDAVALVLGGQLGWSKRQSEDRFLSNGDDSGKATYDYFNPKIGMIWDGELPHAGGSWQVYGNLSRSTEVPTLTDLSPTAADGFAKIDPQTATTIEVGTRGRRETFGWDVALYRAWLRDEIQLFDLGGSMTAAANADRTIHQGVEMAFDVTLLKGLFADGKDADDLWFRQSYTFSDFHFDDGVYGGNDLPGAPKHYLRAELLYRHPAGFYAGPNVEWVPEAYYVDNANTQKTRSYALLGLRAGYGFAFQGLNGSVFLDARNITDERYIASASVSTVATPTSAVYEPGSGASAYAGLTLSW